MIEQVLEQIELPCFDREEVLCINKVDSIVKINIIKDVKMTEVPFKSVHSTFFQPRSRIQSTQNKFELIKFGNSKRKKPKNH